MTEPILTDELKAKIDGMSQHEMAYAWRYAPAGSVYFTRGPVFDYFEKSFKEKGGMTSSVSKDIGWDG